MNDNVLLRNETVMVRLYREEDQESLLRLSTLHYGDKDLASKDYVHWLHKGIPSAGPSTVVVAAEPTTDEIIGFVWHVPFCVDMNGEPLRCYLGCNGLVHPDYRSKGVYKELHDLVFKKLKGNAFIYGFPKPVAVRPLQRVGIFPVCNIPLLLRPLDIASLSSARLPNAGMRLAVNLGWNLAASTVLRSWNRTNGTSSIEVGFESNFDASYDDLWERVKNKYEICIKRDHEFLTWRFTGLPSRNYQILAARRDGQLLGYAVLRCTSIEQICIGLIVDIMVEPGERGDWAGWHLVEQATRFFQQQEMSLVGCLMLPHTQEYTILRKAGYIQCPQRFSPQPFRLVSASLSTSISNQFLAETDRWFVTMANHDAI